MYVENKMSRVRRVNWGGCYTPSTRVCRDTTFSFLLCVTSFLFLLLLSLYFSNTSEVKLRGRRGLLHISG